ncbi:176_t:CDS:2 [Funneliformis mosseae]|uniref:176_t:CDS:1 n=1 Tax=Funneliformis mosseae TaxID=27381 RepID=A0A9N8VB23_FUNMO|nr:176_t:CDS:2 [Funneliformis mosseae]
MKIYFTNEILITFNKIYFIITIVKEISASQPDYTYKVRVL